jgi:hypothetical protein
VTLPVFLRHPLKKIPMMDVPTTFRQILPQCMTLLFEAKSSEGDRLIV